MKCYDWQTVGNNLRWDRYDAFHWQHHTHDGVEITQFDTGELIVRAAGHRPDLDGRTYYSNVGFRIMTTTNDDGWVPVMLEDGTPVPRAWFGPTMQTVLVDDDTGYVVGLGGGYTTFHTARRDHVYSSIAKAYAEAEGIPSRFVDLGGGLVWFPGAGRIPRSNRPIRLDRPIMHTREAWAQARAYRTAAQAWVQLTGVTHGFGWADGPCNVLDIIQFPTFGDMPDAHKWRLAHGGLTAGTEPQCVSSLRVRTAAATTMPRTTSGAHDEA